MHNGSNAFADERVTCPGDGLRGWRRSQGPALLALKPRREAGPPRKKRSAMLEGRPRAPLPTGTTIPASAAAPVQSPTHPAGLSKPPSDSQRFASVVVSPQTRALIGCRINDIYHDQGCICTERAD